MDTLIGSVCWEDNHACKYVFCNPSVRIPWQFVFMFISQSSVLGVLRVYAKRNWCVVACLEHGWARSGIFLSSDWWKSAVMQRLSLNGLISLLHTLPVQRNEREEGLTLMTFTNLDGTGGYLDFVQFPHCAVAIDEVGWSQLMKGFHILSGVGKLPVQLVFGQVHRQCLLS